MSTHLFTSIDWIASTAIVQANFAIALKLQYIKMSQKCSFAQSQYSGMTDIDDRMTRYFTVLNLYS